MAWSKCQISRIVLICLFSPSLFLQGKSLDDLETAHFVLVHGGGFGAWCWYKSIALLEEAGYKVTAIDLTGSGIHSFNTNEITSLAQYVKPLTDFLDKLADGEKVLLLNCFLCCTKKLKLSIGCHMVSFLFLLVRSLNWASSLATSAPKCSCRVSFVYDCLGLFLVAVFLAN